MITATTLQSAAIPAFEVDTYDRDGNPILLVGHYDSIAAARDGIADHACVDLEGLGDNNYAASVLPSIVESWFIGPVEYIIHRLAA